MPATTHGARSGVCERCHAKYTLVITLEQVGDIAVTNLAPFTCPKCGHCGSVTAQAGQRIVKVETKAYSDMLGS